MGADLLCVWAWTTKPDEIDFDKARREINAAFDALPTDIEMYPEGFLERWDPNGFDEEEPDLMRDTLLKATDALEALWNDGYDRSAFRAEMGPVTFLMAGGTSFGDSPSETFDVMSRWIDTPAAKAAGFFQTD